MYDYFVNKNKHRLIVKNIYKKMIIYLKNRKKYHLIIIINLVSLYIHFQYSQQPKLYPYKSIFHISELLDYTQLGKDHFFTKSHCFRDFFAEKTELEMMEDQWEKRK